VLVAEDQVSADFTFTAPAAEEIGDVTASLGAVALTSTITTVAGGAALVINEVDYDQVGSDTTEFIEIHNGAAAAVDLTSLAVVLVNGAGNLEYQRFMLADAGASLPAGGYLVISNANVTVPGGALHLVVTTANDIVQNGAPDGIALIDTAASTVLDALSYEGSITAAQITGFAAAVSLVEGTATGVADDNVTAMRSLIRSPNGADTDDAAADWAASTTLTPGAAN
jgi:hypothetical protein